MKRPGNTDDAPLDLDSLDRLEPLRTIPGRNSTKADILVYRHGTLQVALKDYRPRPWWVRLTLGRLMIARESSAYKAASGIDGVAPFLGRLGPLCLATEWVEGRTLRSMRGQPVDQAVFDRVRETVDLLHAAGIALGDLHLRDILVDDDGRIALVDLATAFSLGPRPGWLRSGLFRWLRFQDDISCARLQDLFLDQDPLPAVEALGPRAARAYLRRRRLKHLNEWLRGRRGT